MAGLTDKEFWDAEYRTPAPSGPPPRRWARRILGERGVSLVRALLRPSRHFPPAAIPYAEHLLFDVLGRRFLPRAPASMVEVGSAPGTMLVKFRERFGYDLWGIEYADHGVEENRRVFARHGVPPEQVVHADFFSPEVRERFAGRFDVVLSRGFIEHFDDPRDVVARHVELLKPGGTLVITIPNFRGVNHALTRFFYPPYLTTHNFAIMRLPAFRRIFENQGLEPLHCGYYGTFHLGLLYADPGSARDALLRLLLRAQPVLNALFRLFLRDRGSESSTRSPYLIYIGRRLHAERGRAADAEQRAREP